jgi:hypothetical protein
MDLANGLPDGDRIVLMPPERLLPHERHDPDRVRTIAAEMQERGCWIKPLLVERRHLIILDGHHRWQAAKALRLAVVPLVLIGYEDPRLTLSAWRETESWTPQDVIACALSGRLCPIKTTRHVLSPPLPPISLSLADLSRGLAVPLPQAASGLGSPVAASAALRFGK